MDLIVCFSFLSYPTHYPTAQLIMSHCTTWSGTYCSFTSDEPCAHFLDYHSYLTCLYLPFDREYKFPSPDFRPPFCAFSPSCITLHHLTVPPSLPVMPCLETIPYSQIAPQSPIGFMLRLPAPSILAAS